MTGTVPVGVRGRVWVDVSSADEIRRHGERLLRQHAEESEPDLADCLNPDWDFYASAESQGQLIALAAWYVDADGVRREIVGYVAALVFRSPHYSDQTWCQNDVLFVDPQWRSYTLRIGRQLMERLEREARERSVERLLCHAKPCTSAQALFERIGYTVEEIVLVKEL